MKRLLTLPAALILLTTVAQAQATTNIDMTELEAYLRHMEMWVPQVNVEIAAPTPAASLPGFLNLNVHLSYNGQGKDEHYYISNDGKSIIKGEAFPVGGNPFQEKLDKLKTANAPSFGTASAPIQIVVFGDFQCPYCKSEAQIMRANLVPTFGDLVQVYFKDFPLESIHPWARAGSIAGRCVFDAAPQVFWEFHDWIYAVQEEITPENLKDKVTGWAGENGMDVAQLGSCIDTKASEPAVNANIAEARDLGVSATPTIFVNGRMLPGAIQWEVLKQLIDLELQHLGIDRGAAGAE